MQLYHQTKTGGFLLLESATTAIFLLHLVRLLPPLETGKATHSANK